MHVCVMHIFCAVMCVETPFIYHKARKLLFAACPSGSAVALIQMRTMLQYTTDIRSDVFAQLIVCLLSIRALSGFIQVLGLFHLKHLEELPSKQSDTDHLETERKDIHTRLWQLQRVLWGCYVPIMLIYIATFSMLGNCSPPLISKSLYPGECTESGFTDFALAQNWPGLGLVFHYGMIIVIFAANGARASAPTYRPSLMIASLFSFHVSALIFIDLGYDAYQTTFWSDLSTEDVIRRLLVVAWMLASFLLWFFCERVLQVRLAPL